MVMKQVYGVDRMARFLKYETHQYLEGRGKEKYGEPALIEVEYEPYVFYHRASIAFYALQDAIGEASVNRVLRDYLRQVAYQSPPYATAGELVDRLRDATPAGYPNLIEDLFETITLYDNRIVDGSCKAVPGKGYDVTLRLELQKLKADAQGEETPVDLADTVDVALYNSGDRLLMSSRIDAAQSPLDAHLMVSERPAKAVLDPWYKLVERHREDNDYALCK